VTTHDHSNGVGVSFLGVRHIRSQPSFLFAVDTQNGPVFMRVVSEPHGDDQRCVVVVRAEAFVKLWRQNIRGAHRDVAEGSPATWPLDYKYASMEKDFSASESLPVSLADVACHQDIAADGSTRGLIETDCSAPLDGSPPFLSIQNGVTRSIWLLSNGATMFPVKCRARDRPDLLAAHAGVSCFPMQTVEHLFP